MTEENIERSPVDLRAMIDALARRWYLVLAVPLVCLIATATVLRMVPAAYQAGVQILIFDPQLQGEAAIGQQPASAHNFDTVAINTEIEVVKSTALLLRVARELRLDEYPEFQKSSRSAGLLDRFGLYRVIALVEELSEPLGHGKPDSATDHAKILADAASAGARRIETAAALLRQRLTVSNLPLSYVLVVSASARSPELAQRVAARVVDDYLASQRELRQNASRQAAGWLKERLSELQSRVVETETAIEKLKAQSGLGDTGKGSVNEQQITDLNGQLMLAKAEVTEKRAQLQQARETSSGGSGAAAGIPEDAATSSLMGQLRLQQSDLIRREAELRSKLGDRHAGVLAVEAQLAGVNKAMDGEARRVLVGLQNAVDIAVRREQSLEVSLQRLTAAQSDSGDYVRMQQLQRLADADTKLYENYLSQYNEIEIQASVPAVGARIIAPATVSTAPSFPNHQIVFYAAASVLGSMLGVMLALLPEYFRPSIHTGSQAEQMFGYPVVGALPLVSQGRSRRGRAHRELVEDMVSEPLSPFSEAIRAIRIGLHLSDRHQAPKVILVTSSLPGEGKSAIAMLLAASSAGARQRAVLVDCDLRGRAVSHHFGQPESGLTELLAGTADVKSVTIRDAVTGCFVIPAGTSGDVPADLLSTERMDEVIDQLRNDFDFVVLDTPPLLSVVDALTLTPLVDKILLTIDRNAADCENVAEALRLLRPDANRIAGMVFNKLPEKAIARYRYGGYGYPYAAPASVTTVH